MDHAAFILGSWIGLLAVFAVIFAVAGTVAFGPLVDE